MTLAVFQKEIEQLSKKKLKLKINDNRSTMLSVKWEPGCTKVSMHRIFLEAPKNIMDALSCHIRKENSAVSPTVKAYIENKLKSLDYSSTLDKAKLVTDGNVYDLREVYEYLNDYYFGGVLDLSITWYGKSYIKNRSRFTFGLYFQPLKLIKIHKMLDSLEIPLYFIEYVIYHEMLHHVCPSYYDESGRNHVHTPEFKKREKTFKDFKKAQEWLKINSHHFFID